MSEILGRMWQWLFLDSRTNLSSLNVVVLVSLDIIKALQFNTIHTSSLVLRAFNHILFHHYKSNICATAITGSPIPSPRLANQQFILCLCRCYVRFPYLFFYYKKIGILGVVVSRIYCF
jgi:hypothetical protein